MLTIDPENLEAIFGRQLLNKLGIKKSLCIMGNPGWDRSGN